MIDRLVPPGVVVVVADAAMWDAPMHPEEERVVARAVEKRRRDFAAGRACARLALARLGIGPGPLLPGEKREPQWPAGIVGSITHCQSYCAAAVAWETDVPALGVDAEVHGPLEPGVEQLVCLPHEVARFPRGGARIHWPMVLFSAKESVYKAWYPRWRTGLEFHDVDVSIEPEDGSFRALVTASSPVLFEGRFAVEGDHVFSTAVTSAQPLSAS